MSAPGLAALLFALIAPSGEGWRPPELRVAHRSDSAPASFDALKGVAFSYLGRPYVMGGVGDPGFDCSGFTCRVFAESGYAIPRVSRDQVLAGRAVALDQLAPGDLLFFVADPGKTRISHVGLYLGGGELIHASTGGGKVEVASIRSSWFRSRLVAARRILPDPPVTMLAEAGSTPPIPSEAQRLVALSASPTSPVDTPLAPTRELIEHGDDDELPPMLRVAPLQLPLALGPSLARFTGSSLGLRTAALTEAGVMGLVLSPELAIRVERWALLVELAAPIRFAAGHRATFGAVDSVADLLRFVRAIELGVRGAELELAISRLGDLSLGEGAILERLAPASRSSGVPGLSIARSPLSFFASVRSMGGVDLSALIDDLRSPGLFGVGAAFETPVPGLEISGAIATDQRATCPSTVCPQAGSTSALATQLAPEASAVDPADRAPRRAVTAAEASAKLALLDERRSQIGLAVTGAGDRTLGSSGFGLDLSLSAAHRFGHAEGSAIQARIDAAELGPNFLLGLFGPTYVSAPAAQLAALEGTAARPALGGEVLLRIDEVAVGAGYGDAFSDRRAAFDRRFHAIVELSGLSLGGTRLLDLRAVYAARGDLLGDMRMRAPSDPPAGASVLHAGARLRLDAWAFLEAYVEKSDGFEGGLGLAIAWLP